MALHLNYDGKQNNGIIGNEAYPNGALFVGIKPELTFEYDSFQYSEMFTNAPDYVELNGIKKPMTAEQTIEVRNLAKNWVQELGQEGNPNQEQIQKANNAKNMQYLYSTDWYVARFIETGIPIPDDVRTSRAIARESIK